MKSSGIILFFLLVFFVLYFLDTSHAIYDPRDPRVTKPPKRREFSVPWYLSSDTPDPQISGWDQNVDSTPRNPVIVIDGARTKRPQDDTVTGTIEQETIGGFNNNYQQVQGTHGGHDFQQTNDLGQTAVDANQHYDENGWFIENDDIQKPYEDFAIEIQKPYKDTKDFTTKSVEVIKVAKYDPATGAQCPTADATGQYVYPPDCKYFVNCWNGRAFVQPCAPGTLFNPDTLECDFPSKVICYGKELADLNDLHGVQAPANKQPLSAASPRNWRVTSSNNDPSCPPGATGLLPYPNDCTKFLQCANGATFIMDCGPGTAFNPAISVCDWPYNVEGCTDSLKLKTETTTVPYWGGIDVRSDFPKFPEPRIQPHVVSCPDGHDGLLPHPSDCKKFLQCNNGFTHIMDCGPGTVFNPTISTCDWPYNVRGCENPQILKVETTTISMRENIDVRGNFHQRPEYPVESDIARCPDGQEGLFPYPNDCGKYLQCSNGNTQVMDCGPGTVFNPLISGCDFPYNVEGCDQEKQTVTESSRYDTNSWGQNSYGQNGQHVTTFGHNSYTENTPTGQNFYNRPDHERNNWNNGHHFHGDNHGGNHNTNWHRYHNHHNHGHPTGSSHHVPSHGNWNWHIYHHNHHNDNAHTEGSFTGVTQYPILPERRMDEQTTPHENIYVDSGYQLPGSDVNLNGYEPHATEFPTPNPAWIDLQPSTTTENTRSHQGWNQEETNIDEPGRFKPSTWGGHEKEDERPSNQPVDRPWLQGKGTDRELDWKLDQWAMKTNIFQQAHAKPGIKSRKQGKGFSDQTNTKKNTTNLSNSNLFPNGIYARVDGIKGHFITKELEINQGHSKTRQYGNQNWGDGLEKPDILSVATNFHEKIDNRSSNPESGSNIPGPPKKDDIHRVKNETHDLLPSETNYLRPKIQNNFLEKPANIHDLNYSPNGPHVECDSYKFGERNCVYLNNLTEGGRDNYTTDRNTLRVEIELENNNDGRLNETMIENTTKDSGILGEDEILRGDMGESKNERKPKLISENKSAEDTDTSVIMKINNKKNDIDIFGVELINDKDEPPFPVSYMPPVVPVNYDYEAVQSTPISGQVLRLRGGSVLEEGYLEVQGAHAGWGIVCDRSNEWTLKEANVVCRQLGYTRGAEMAWQGRSNEEQALYWIAADSVNCIGNETFFQSCKFTHDTLCDVTRDAVGIRCLPNRIAYCREDEIPHRGFCYHLANSNTALNHAEALRYCNSKGSKLLDIIDQNENNFVSDWLVQKYPEIDSLMTSGFGYTIFSRTLWLWEDSQHAKFRFSKWWPGWMSDKKTPPSVGARPSCVVMKRNFPCHNRPDESCNADYFFWDVEDCAASSKGHSYICKRAYNDIGCVYGKGQHYSGEANVTASGTRCLPWADESIRQYLNFKVISEDVRNKLKEHNYCRNPNPNRELKPWCFTGSRGEYDYCDIPSCAKQGMKKSVAAGQCKPKHFECTPGECIPSPWICDGEEDCTNGADEQACFQHLDDYTKIEHHRLDGYDVEKWLNTPLKTCALRCKEADFTCRSFSHKADGNVCLLSDSNIGLTGALQPSEDHDYYEMKKRSIDCSDMFLCGNQKCINQSLVCDGKNNCEDRTDESTCDLQNLEYEIRLSGSNNTGEGRVEVKVWGHWGQVCDDGFGMIAANVACKELGFTFGAREVRSAGFYRKGGVTSFLMDQVKCRGNETSLRECDFDGWGVHNCLPDEAVGIVCKQAVNSCQDGFWKCDNSPECIPTPFICDEVTDCADGSDEGPEHCEAPFQLRLSGGSSPLEGRVEVRHHGIWGTVCDDDFSKATAAVICSSLGYGGTATPIKDGAFGPGEGPIWLDEVFCSGNETQLYKCDHEPWGRHNCGHDEDVGVRCELGEVIEHERTGKLAPDLPEINVNDILPTDCGMRLEDFDESDEYMARVVQGSVAPKGAYPWQASLRIRGQSRSSHWCGAVVISPLYVLTAAHCLEGYNKGMYFVRAGDFNTEIDDGTEVEVNIEDYYIHEDFRKGQRMNNDIALVLLKGRGIPLGRNIMPICLPPENVEYLPGLNCTISGWGSIESGKSVQSNFLRFGWVPILDQSICRADYVYGEGAISDGMVCAGYLDEGVDSCDGDSGGPLACYHNNAFTLYGLTSWGKHCGAHNKPGVYVRIAHYRRWIDQKIRESSSGR